MGKEVAWVFGRARIYTTSEDDGEFPLSYFRSTDLRMSDYRNKLDKSQNQ